MAKRTVQTSKPGFTVGVEYDHVGIRAARLASNGKGGNAVDRLEEIRGDFAEDAELVEGLKQLKDKLGMGARDLLVACLAGKQVFASQFAFRKLPIEEMEQALRLELRKSVHFEVATSTMDYQILNEDARDEETQVLVALAANGLLSRQLKVLAKAGLKPAAVDVLPVAAANALWTWHDGNAGDTSHVALHVGPQVSTIVIDGESSPFFNRNVYFSAEEVFGRQASPGDREKRVHALADEILRSLAFYEKSTVAKGFHELALLGEYLDSEGLTELLAKHTRLTVRRMDLPKKMGFAHEMESGRFDLAVALALRGEA